MKRYHTYLTVIKLQDLIAKYGRGQKIDPTHYINPRFEKHERVAYVRQIISDHGCLPSQRSIAIHSPR